MDPVRREWDDGEVPEEVIQVGLAVLHAASKGRTSLYLPDVPEVRHAIEKLSRKEDPK